MFVVAPSSSFFLNADTVIVVNDLTQRLLFTILVRSAIHDDTSSGLQVVLLRISGMSQHSSIYNHNLHLQRHYLHTLEA